MCHFCTQGFVSAPVWLRSPFLSLHAVPREWRGVQYSRYSCKIWVWVTFGLPCFWKSVVFQRAAAPSSPKADVGIIGAVVVPGKAPPGLAQVVRVQRQEQKKMAARKTCEGFWLFSIRKLMPASQGMGSDIGCQMQSAFPFHGNNYDSEIFS